jgi:AraC family L-rhamnose operon regulatory protein RhaS
MERYRQYSPVLISDFEVITWHHPVHNHNHYELIYIKKGTGSHIINDVAITYEAGAIFLLGPEERHYFEIEQPTRFVYLKFTDIYLHQVEHEYNSWIHQLEYLIKNREARTTRFNLKGDDKNTIDQLFNVVTSLNKSLGQNEQLLWMQIMSIAVVLKRNLPEIISSSGQSRDMQTVFCYIHENIYKPEQLKAESMAKHFNTTKDYIGPYFKRNTGTSLRNYITDYRTGLIRKRIDSGNYTLKQIAAEFGLSDESHVSKLIKNK